MTTPYTQFGQAQPGWYTDPATGSVMYWDGQVWSAPTGAPQAQAMPAHGQLPGYPAAGTWAAARTDLPADLSGAPLGPVEAVRSGFRNMFTVRGRASRSAYWWFAGFQLLAAFVLMIVVSMFAYAVNPGADPDAVTALWLLTWLPIVIAQITLLGRRLHDSNKSAHFLWLAFLPYVGSFALFVMALLDPKDPNRFAQRAAHPMGNVPNAYSGYPSSAYGQPSSPYRPVAQPYGSPTTVTHGQPAAPQTWA